VCDDPEDVQGSLGGVLFLAPDRAPSAEALATLLARAAAAVRPGGVLVAEAGGPVAAEEAAQAARDAGFTRADVRFGAGPHGYLLVARP
jgi:pyruvate/2-oxoglutarate dehydrogenase complex dihydrolipoamide acyltransferase (E2) component